MNNEDPSTRAPVPPPPKKSSNRLTAALGEPSAIADVVTPNNAAKPSDDRLKDLNFKVEESFHVEFKTTASVRRMSMKELLEACFAAWKDKHGGISRDLID